VPNPARNFSGAGLDRTFAKWSNSGFAGIEIRYNEFVHFVILKVFWSQVVRVPVDGSLFVSGVVKWVVDDRRMSHDKERHVGEEVE